MPISEGDWSQILFVPALIAGVVLLPLIILAILVLRSIFVSRKDDGNMPPGARGFDVVATPEQAAALKADKTALSPSEQKTPPA